MDATKKQQLVTALAVAGNFDEDYGDGSWAWFVESLISEFEVWYSDAEIEQKTRDLVASSKTRVAADRDFALALVAGGNTRFTAKALKAMRRHRVEILYGAIARHPDLGDPAQRDYLLFLARRRFRSVCRMFFWVNPNPQGYFFYPHKCRTNQRMRVNEDAAAAFWNVASSGAALPIPLKPAGVADPVAAIDKLFVKKKGEPCKSNLFDCAVVAEIMFLDALMEAKDPTRFLKALGSTYLQIQHMDHSAFRTGGSDKENTITRIAISMPPRDLQVGDQCYIYNHPLYKSFRPTGSWRGEFSYVFASGNRDYKSKKGFVFGGHGKEGTLYQFYDAFVAELSTYLALVRQLSQAHLLFMRAGASAIVPGTILADVEDDVAVTDPVTRVLQPASPHRLLVYDKTLITRDFLTVPTQSKRKPKAVQAGFLIVHSKTEHVFYLAKVDDPDEDKPLVSNLKKTLAEIPTPRQIKYPIKVKRLTAPSSGASPNDIYAIKHWGVAYADPVTSTERPPWPFFEVIGGELKRKELTTDAGDPVADLFNSPFHPFTKNGANVEVYQPRVDFATHRSFLASNGAF